MPAGIVTDSFNRADGAIGVTDGGSLSPLTWANAASGGTVWSVNGNKAQASTAGTYPHCTIDTGDGTISWLYVEAKFDTITTGDMGLVLFYQDVNNYWFLGCEAGPGTLVIKKKLAGVTTLMHTVHDINGNVISVASGDTVKVRLAGGSGVFSVWKNGSFCDNYGIGDGALTSNIQRCGMLSASVTARLDNFSATQIFDATVTDVSPPSGSTAGGDTITLTGTHFDDVASVYFVVVSRDTLTEGSEDAASFNVISPTSMTMVTPAMPFGASGGYGQFSLVGTLISIGGEQFQFIDPDPPVVDSVDPPTVKTGGGDTIVITGSHLADTDLVRFGDVVQPFSDDPATAHNDTQIILTNTPHAVGTYPVHIHRRDGATT